MPRRFISIWKGSFVDAFLLRMKKKTDPLLNRKIWSRRSSILPEFVNCSVRIYNGKSPVRCKEKLVINLESLLLHGNEDKKEGEEKRRKSQNKTHMAQKQNKAHMARKGNPISKRIIVLLLCIVFITGLCLLLEYQQFLERLQSMLLGRSIRFLFSRLLGREVAVALIVLLCLVSGLGHCDAGLDRPPTPPAVERPEEAIQAQQVPLQPAPPVIPELEHPLLSDEVRSDVLYSRYGIQNFGGDDGFRRMNSIISNQVIVERSIEAALVDDGFHPLSILRRYAEIRGILHSPQGELLSERTYRAYVSQITEQGTRESVPYRRVIQAVRGSDLLLERTDGRLF